MVQASTGLRQSYAITTDGRGGAIAVASDSTTRRSEPQRETVPSSSERILQQTTAPPPTRTVSHERLRPELCDSATRDPLTQAYNRRYLAARLDIDVTRARFDDGDLGVILFDIDGFTHLNDRCGHLAGDRALCAVVRRLSRDVRAGDALARYGGDEFVTLVSGLGHVELVRLAERLCRAVGTLLLGTHRDGPFSLTISVGAASLGELSRRQRRPTPLLGLANARLHAAQRAGGNCVCAT
jgi:diguanylate cyclase (GGDEF)-like protein